MVKPATQRVLQDTSSSTTATASSSTSPAKLANRQKPFLDGRVGSDLRCEIIAHDARVQTAMDQKQIAWGVQWELARGVTLGAWKWEDVLGKLAEFEGNNTDAAYKVVSTMQNKPVLRRNISVWQELDREQLAIMENMSRGLGCMGEWEGDSDWHGGQIQQLGRLTKVGQGYKIHLQPLEKRRSHRFGRFLGSRRIIQIRVPDELITGDNDRVRCYLTRKFILCGRVFVPFHAKEGSVYLMETNEDYERISMPWCGDQFRLSLFDFIDWHNPLHLNEQQAISKWSTRFALGLSTSTPALEFQQDNIFEIKDICRVLF